MVSKLNDKEAAFIRRTIKEAVSDLHDVRRKMQEHGQLGGVMDIEEEIDVADSAWHKLKEELWGTTQ